MQTALFLRLIQALKGTSCLSVTHCEARQVLVIGNMKMRLVWNISYGRNGGENSAACSHLLGTYFIKKKQ